MSDQIQNMLIIAVAAVLIVGIILFVLRDKISQINFKAKGIDANVKTRVNKGITISKVKQKGDGNKLAMKAIVDSGEVPGILAYHSTKAIGWCAIAPRGSYPALSRSRILQPVDNRPCWSVACLFIERSYRKRGISAELLRAASEYARSQGAELVEGYPVEPKSEKDIPPAFAWTGISKAFVRVGFIEVIRRSPTRPIMRMEFS